MIILLGFWRDDFFFFVYFFIVKEECKYGMDGINYSRDFGSILVNDDEMEWWFF